MNSTNHPALGYLAMGRRPPSHDKNEAGQTHPIRPGAFAAPGSGAAVFLSRFTTLSIGASERQER